MNDDDRCVQSGWRGVRNGKAQADIVVGCIDFPSAIDWTKTDWAIRLVVCATNTGNALCQHGSNASGQAGQTNCFGLLGNVLGWVGRKIIVRCAIT